MNQKMSDDKRICHRSIVPKSRDGSVTITDNWEEVNCPRCQDEHAKLNSITGEEMSTSRVVKEKQVVYVIRDKSDESPIIDDINFDACFVRDLISARNLVRDMAEDQNVDSRDLRIYPVVVGEPSIWDEEKGWTIP